MTELKQCPCGQTPSFLHVVDTMSGKWINATGDCCGAWSVEGRNDYAIDTKRYENAIKAWNYAIRGE